MSRRRSYPDDDPTTFEEHLTGDAIASAVAAAGVHFERWSAEESLPDGAGPEEILAAYRKQVDELMAKHGFVTADVVAMDASTPDPEGARRKFLSEHTHSEDEARFFIGGAGLFCIHHRERVFALLCEKDDLINVPAGTKHWFDMGPEPDFRCIRVFTDPSGWVANFTGSDMADRFPKMGES
ncbi:MAG: acireductone dioxygenase [Proteobacteria bacterium]|nr:acireductone dioxygenase [Pseudomonadota bacterium]